MRLTDQLLEHLVDASRLVGEALTERPRRITPEQEAWLRELETKLDEVQAFVRTRPPGATRA